MERGKNLNQKNILNISNGGLLCQRLTQKDVFVPVVLTLVLYPGFLFSRKTQQYI